MMRILKIVTRKIAWKRVTARQELPGNGNRYDVTIWRVFFSRIEDRISRVLNIPVQNLRSMGYLAPWLDFHWFNKFYLYVISLIYTTLAFVKKENSKRDIYKLVKPMEVNRTCIAWFHEFSLDVSSLTFPFLQMLML